MVLYIRTGYDVVMGYYGEAFHERQIRGPGGL